ncbi:MAG: SpoVR family protein [Desulfobacterales bacterium]
MTVITEELNQWQVKIEAVARRQGLDFFPTIFDVVDWDIMAEVASYHGFPDHYSHWKFGESYINMRKSFTYGLSKIYEMVINADPALAYLLEENKLVDQKMVMAHVFAHVDFFKNNAWFAPTDRNMLASSRGASERIERYRKEYGQTAVDDFITDCMKIDNLIDSRMPYMEAYREKNPRSKGERTGLKRGEQPFRFKSDLPYLDEFINPPDWIELQAQREKHREERQREARTGLRFPAKPVRDILLFLLRYAPLEKWQRDVLDIIRQESYYFLPQAKTKIANEGWAAYWHSQLMVKRGLASQAEIVDYAQHNAGTLGSPGFNPYKLGLLIYRDIEYRWDSGRHGLLWENCRSMMENDASWDDFVVFKNIYEENPNDIQDKWAQWCFFKHACKNGLWGFPKDLYEREKRVRWWCEYRECEAEWIRLEREYAQNESSHLAEEIKSDRRWCRILVDLKKAWEENTFKNDADRIPDEFFAAAGKYPGKVLLGQGRRKIFEIRRRINDFSLISEFFTPELFEKSPMFSYRAGGGGVSPDHWGVDAAEFEGVKKKLLFTLFNRGEPVIEIVNAQYAWSKNKTEKRGTGLYLKHRHEGADLKRDEMEDTLRALFALWQNPVYLETILTEKSKRSAVPPEILKQMGIEVPEESKTRRGTVKIYFTSDGKEITELDKETVEVRMPY